VETGGKWPGNYGPGSEGQLAAVSRIVPDPAATRLFGTRAGKTARGSPLRVPPGTKAADHTTAGRSLITDRPAVIVFAAPRTSGVKQI
jgi:hypothetical protein